MKKALLSLFQRLLDLYVHHNNRTEKERLGILVAGAQLQSLAMLILMYLFRNADLALADQSHLSRGCVLQSVASAYICILVPLMRDYMGTMTTFHVSALGMSLMMFIEAFQCELVISPLCSLIRMLLFFGG